MTDPVQIAAVAALLTALLTAVPILVAWGRAKRREGADLQDRIVRLERLERWYDRYHDEKWSEWRTRKDIEMESIQKVILGQEKICELVAKAVSR